MCNGSGDGFKRWRRCRLDYHVSSLSLVYQHVEMECGGDWVSFPFLGFEMLASWASCVVA